MKNCSVIECKEPGLYKITPLDSTRPWEVCIRHSDKILAGCGWDVLEGGKQILVGQVNITVPALLDWSVVGFGTGELKLMLRTNRQNTKSAPLALSLTQDQAAHLAMALINQPASQPVHYPG